jgi:hypothetical protein
VARILRDPVLAGLNADSEPCVCGHDAIVSVEVWRRSQKLMEGEGSAARRGRRPVGLVFRKGMLRCGLCGDAMVPRSDRRGPTYMCMTRNRQTKAGCQMPIVDGKVIDAAVLSHFQTVGLSLEDTCRDVVAAHDRQLAEARVLLAQAERAEQQAVERLERVKRDYQDGRLDPDDWREQRCDLEGERKAAAAEAIRHRQRESELAGQDALADAEQHVLEHLATIREAIAGDVSSQSTLEGLRAALLALFEGFTLHSVRLAVGDLPAALFVRGEVTPDYEYLIEPHVRVDAIARRVPIDTDGPVTIADGQPVELHRVPLALGRNKEPARSQCA